MIRWNRSDLKTCFDPVINQIIELVKEQTEATQKGGYPKIDVSGEPN